MLRTILFLSLATLISGCAIGNKYDYRTANPTIEAEGTRTVGVAVSDQRPYVLSGDKTPDFIGLQRGGYGNPFDVSTVSGAPMTVDMTAALVTALQARGYQAVPMSLSPGQEPDRLPDGADRVLFLKVREWKSDVFGQVTMHWDLEAQVLDAGLRPLASNAIKEVRGTGTRGLESDNEAIAVNAFSVRVGDLLNTDQMLAALR